MFPDQTLSPRLQRWLFGLTVGFAALTVIFGIWAQAGALAGLNDAPEGLGWLTEIVFSAAGLLAFNRPTPLPAGWQYGVAQLSATGFALSASSVLLLTLLASVRTTLRRAHIKLATALRPGRGHTVIIGLGETGWHLLEDLRPKERLLVRGQGVGGPDRWGRCPGAWRAAAGSFGWGPGGLSYDG